MRGRVLAYFVGATPFYCSSYFESSSVITSYAMNYQPTLCGFCNELPTHHRCKHPVKKGGAIVDGQRICGEFICSTCSVEFGTEEGVYRCVVHCGGEAEVEEVKDDNAGSKKKKDSKPTAKSIKSGVKSTEYSSKDLLVLAQSFIRVSENAVEGASQKRAKFWDEVSVAYNKLKAQQEAYDKRHRKKEKYNEVRLRGEYLCDDSDDDVTYVIAVRTPSSLQQKWSKSLQPIVTKFISVTNRHPKVSGEGKFFSLVASVALMFFTNKLCFCFPYKTVNAIIIEFIKFSWPKIQTLSHSTFIVLPGSF
jgi:hypothetical protein